MPVADLVGESAEPVQVVALQQKETVSGVEPSTIKHDFFYFIPGRNGCVVLRR